MWDEQIEAESEEIERKDEITAYSIRTQVQRRKVSIILKSTLAEKFDSADESFEMSPARSRNNFRAAEKRKISLHFFGLIWSFIYWKSRVYGRASEPFSAVN